MLFTNRLRRWGRARVIARQRANTQGFGEPVMTAFAGVVGLPAALVADAVVYLVLRVADGLSLAVLNRKCAWQRFLGDR